MRLLIILTTALALSYSAAAQTVSNKVAEALGGSYIGGEQIAGDHPSGYEDFLVMWVDDIGICRKDVPVNRKENFLADANGRIMVCGRVVFKGRRYPQGDSDSDGKYLIYSFKEAYLADVKGKPIQLFFETKTVEGVSYNFEGTYLEDGKEQSNEGRVHLEGIMSKFMSGKKVSETKLRFSPYIIME